MANRASLCALLAGLVASATGAAAAQGHDDTDARLAIERYDGAWAARDGTTLGELVAPGFVYFTSKGGEWSRARWFDFMLSPDYRLEAAKRSAVVVTSMGDTAVASTRWTGQGSYEGRPFSDDQRCSITLARGAGQWRILSEHCTQIVLPPEGREQGAAEP